MKMQGQSGLAAPAAAYGGKFEKMPDGIFFKQQ